MLKKEAEEKLPLTNPNEGLREAIFLPLLLLSTWIKYIDKSNAVSLEGSSARNPDALQHFCMPDA